MVLVIIVRILTPKLHSRKTSDLLTISDPDTGDVVCSSLNSTSTY